LWTPLTLAFGNRNFVEEKYAQGTWQRKAYDNFTSALVAKDKTFPCIYGTKGYKANEIDFVFLNSEDLDDTDVAKVGAKAILEYHKTLRHRGRNLSLVLMSRHPPLNAASMSIIISSGPFSSACDNSTRSPGQPTYPRTPFTGNGA